MLLAPSSRWTVTGLISGKRYCFRVAAMGAAGPGPYSNVEQIMAP